MQNFGTLRNPFWDLSNGMVLCGYIPVPFGYVPVPCCYIVTAQLNLNWSWSLT
jgi:hypothetical protein